MFNNSDMINRIKTEKKSQGLTNVDLSNRTNIPLGTLNKILSGESKDPQVSAIIKIAQALKVSADYIAFGQEPQKRKKDIEEISDQDKDFFDDYLNLSVQGKEYMRQTMVMVKETYKKDNTVSDMGAKIG